MSNFVVTGQEKFLAKLKKMENPRLIFDPDVRDTATNSLRELVKGSQGKSAIKTGQTGRAWTPAVKISDAEYIVTNDRKSEDKNHLIVNLINYGHKEIKPVNAKFLFIPFTNRGAARDHGIEFGIDFVLAKSARATEGTNFLKKEKERATKELGERMIKRLRAVHSG